MVHEDQYGSNNVPGDKKTMALPHKNPMNVMEAQQRAEVQQAPYSEWASQSEENWRQGKPAAPSTGTTAASEPAVAAGYRRGMATPSPRRTASHNQPTSPEVMQSISPMEMAGATAAGVGRAHRFVNEEILRKMQNMRAGNIQATSSPEFQRANPRAYREIQLANQTQARANAQYSAIQQARQNPAAAARSVAQRARPQQATYQVPRPQQASQPAKQMSFDEWRRSRLPQMQAAQAKATGVPVAEIQRRAEESRQWSMAARPSQQATENIRRGPMPNPSYQVPRPAPSYNPSMAGGDMTAALRQRSMAAPQGRYADRI